MLNLAAADTIAAVADAASVITSTIHGMELVGSTETYKVLDQRQLAAAAATIYTVPGSTTAFVRAISAVNIDSVAHTCQYFRGGTAQSNAITPSVTIPPNGAAYYEDQGGWSVVDGNMSLLTRGGAGDPQEPNLKVANVKAETIPRALLAEANVAALVSGRLQLQAIWLNKGAVITSISFWSATTAGATLTNQLFGLYDANRNLLATSVNDTSTAWAANSQKSLALSSPASYTVPSTGLYYVGIMVAATTVPTLKGPAAPTATNIRGAAPILNGSADTGLTTTLPNPAAAITVTTTPIWGAVL